jgi:hypothetical protein
MPLVNIGAPQYALPDVLAIDANLLLELIQSKRKPQTLRQIAVARFLKRLRVAVKSGNLLCVTPLNTLEECYFQIIKRYFVKALPTSSSVTWADLYKDNPNLINSCMPLIRHFRALIQSFPVEVLEPEQLGSPPPTVESLLIEYIDKMHILPNVAHLLAVAQRLGVPHIATLDGDFERAASRGFTIYTYIPG